MRLFSKILSILFVLSVLLVLFAPSVKASCSFNSYNQCTGTCSCPAGYCGGCSCVVMYGYCTSYSNCYSCPTSTPAPQPTDTPIPFTSPTVTTAPSPTIGGAVCPNSSYPNCSGTDYCNVTNCGKTIAGCPNPPIPTVPNCSSSCLNGHCYTTQPSTNPTITNIPCNTWGSWGSCLSGSSTCSACASTDYTCQTRFCTNPSNSNQYQISCGCTQPTSPPGNNGSTPTPTAFLRVRLLNPALSPVAFSDVTLCKVRCDTAPCSAVSCQTGVSLADFPGSIPADRGGAIRDGPESPCYGPPSTVYRPPSDRLESLPYCRLRSAICGLFIVSSCLRGEKRINHQDTKSQNFFLAPYSMEVF
jgi:hypothetical protein